MPDSKTLAIKVTTDQNSARQTKTILDGLTASFDKLIGQANRLASTMANLGNGRGMQGVTASSATKGTSGVGSFGPGVRQIGPGRGGLLGNILGAGSGSEISALGTSTVSALGSIETKVKTFVNSTVQELGRLQTAVTNATGAMADMGGGGKPGQYWKSGEWWSPRGKGGGAGGGLEPLEPSEGGGGPGPSTGGSRESHRRFGRGMVRGSKRGGIPRMPGEQPEGTEPEPEEGEKKSFWGSGGFKGYMGSQATRVAWFAGLPSGSASSVGRFAAKYAGPAAIAFGAYKAYDYIAHAWDKQREAQMDWALEKPFFLEQQRATVAAPYNRAYGAARGGDVSYLAAFHSALKDKSIVGAMNNVVLQEEQIAHIFQGAAPGKAIGYYMKKYVESGAANTFEGIRNFIMGPDAGGLNTEEKRSALAIAEEKARAEVPMQFSSKFGEVVSNIQAHMGPIRKEAMNRIQQNALSEVQQLGAMGLSTGIRNVKDVDTGRWYDISAFEDETAKLLKGGWTPGDKAAGYQQLLGIGRGFKNAVNPIELISAGIGGLGNAAALTRVGGVLGGSVGAAKDFYYNTVQGTIGIGGLDVAVGRDLYQSVMEGAFQTGQYGYGGVAQGYAEHLGGLVGYGSEKDVAQQLKYMDMTQRGMGRLNAYGTGKAAPLYKGLGLIGAISAMGGYGKGAEDLAEVDTGVLMGIAEGNKSVPGYLAANGVTPAAIKSELAFRRRMMSAEMPSDRMLGPEALAWKQEVMAAGGDARRAAESHLKGLTGKAWKDEADRLGQLEAATTWGDDPAARAGSLVAQLKAPGKMSGGGAHRPGPKGQAKEALKQTAGGEQTIGEGRAALAPEVQRKKAIRDRQDQYFKEKAEYEAGVHSATFPDYDQWSKIQGPLPGPTAPPPTISQEMKSTDLTVRTAAAGDVASNGQAVLQAFATYISSINTLVGQASPNKPVQATPKRTNGK
jgi:hypothetical protein